MKSVDLRTFGVNEMVVCSTSREVNAPQIQIRRVQEWLLIRFVGLNLSKAVWVLNTQFERIEEGDKVPVSKIVFNSFNKFVERKKYVHQRLTREEKGELLDRLKVIENKHIVKIEVVKVVAFN